MKIRFLPALLLLLLAACTASQTILTTEEKLARADALYAAKKYARAAELYGDVYFERSSAKAAHALLRQADSYYHINRFADARLAYQEFIDAFPNHAELSTAYLRTAQCLFEESLPPQYDQTETQHAIDAFRRFINKFPADPRYDQALEYIRRAQYKLLQKTFHTGYIYYKMKDYSAALMYFKEITDLGNTDTLDRRALYYSALLLHRQELATQARQAYDALTAKYPGSKEAKKLSRHFK